MRKNPMLCDPKDQAEWDRRLSDCFEFAPSYVRRRGKLDMEEYLAQNCRFGEMASTIVLSNLCRLERSGLMRNKILYHCGTGHCRDMEYTPLAAHMGLKVIGMDVSCLAVQIAKGYYDRMIESEWIRERNRPETLHADAEKFFNSNLFRPLDTGLVYFGVTLQHFSLEKMRNTLRGVGKMLRFPHRCVVVIHPLPTEHNLSLTWETSNLHSTEEMLEPLAEGAGRTIFVPQRGIEILFYDQVYTAFAVTA